MSDVAGSCFDSNVIIPALKVPALAKVVDTHEYRCWDAIRRASLIYVPVVAWHEVTRFAKPGEQERLQALKSRVRFLAIDARAVEKACHIQSAEPDVEPCSDCKLSVLAICNKCGSSRSKKNKRNDYLIAASCYWEPRISVLYTFDTELKRLSGKLRSDLLIQDPPSLHGALFDNVEDEKAKASQIPQNVEEKKK